MQYMYESPVSSGKEVMANVKKNCSRTHVNADDDTDTDTRAMA